MLVLPPAGNALVVLAEGLGLWRRSRRSRLVQANQPREDLNPRRLGVTDGAELVIPASRDRSRVLGNRPSLFVAYLLGFLDAAPTVVDWRDLTGSLQLSRCRSAHDLPARRCYVLLDDSPTIAPARKTLIVRSTASELGMDSRS